MQMLTGSQMRRWTEPLDVFGQYAIITVSRTHYREGALGMPSGMKISSTNLYQYRDCTIELLYRMPDHPGILQTFIWQFYDLAPDWPELHRFLGFWENEIEGKIHSVAVARRPIFEPSIYRNAKGLLEIH